MTSRFGLEIRAATGADAQGLCELLAPFGQTVNPRDMAGRIERIRAGPSAALIALEWGPPSGLVVLHWYQTPGDALPHAQITTLVVAPEDRRRGLGRMLLKAAGQTARVAGCGSLELLMKQEYHDLRQFCLATGFEQSGSRFQRLLRKKT